MDIHHYDLCVGWCCSLPWFFFETTTVYFSQNFSFAGFSSSLFLFANLVGGYTMRMNTSCCPRAKLSSQLEQNNCDVWFCLFISLNMVTDFPFVWGVHTWTGILKMIFIPIFFFIISWEYNSYYLVGFWRFQ